MTSLNPDDRINLSKAHVVVIDGSAHSLEVTSQIVKSLGVGSVHRCDTLLEAGQSLARKAADLVIIDPSIENGEGYAFIQRMRHSDWPSVMSPVVLVGGHVRKRDVAKGRDTGANFVIAKPISPVVLLQRILWVVRDKRPFVADADYVGPDRRFKFEGPPSGSDGRRESDLKSPLGEANEPNMSQDEVDALIKPQKVVL